jgi:hypothetical protein
MFELGNESTYAPYIYYLKSQPNGQIPAMWSPAVVVVAAVVVDNSDGKGGFRVEKSDR